MVNNSLASSDKTSQISDLQNGRSVESPAWSVTGWELEDKVGSDLLFVFSEPTQSGSLGGADFQVNCNSPALQSIFTKMQHQPLSPHLTRVQKNNTNSDGMVSQGGTESIYF